jgi:hypothetical protein
LITKISSGLQEPALNMPSTRADAIFPKPKNPNIMCALALN